MRHVRHLIQGRGYPPRLLGFALPTIAVGLPIVAGAVAHIIGHNRPSAHVALGIVVFFLLVLAAELRPVPLDVNGEWLVSFAFVFVVSGVLILGWAWGILIGTVSIFFAQLPKRPGPLRIAFNTAVYAIAGGLASIPEIASHVGPHSNLGVVIGVAFISGAGFVAVNVALVCGAIGLASGQPIRKVMDDHLRHSGPAFTFRRRRSAGRDVQHVRRTAVRRRHVRRLRDLAHRPAAPPSGSHWWEHRCLRSISTNEPRSSGTPLKSKPRVTT